jgi:hypothetical protein
MKNIRVLHLGRAWRICLRTALLLSGTAQESRELRSAGLTETLSQHQVAGALIDLSVRQPALVGSE